jgi:hypothetical protein
MLNNDDQWTDPRAIPGTSQLSPAAVATDTHLFVAWTAPSAEIFLTSSTDGIHWTTPKVANVGLAGSKPALCIGSASVLTRGGIPSLFMAWNNQGTGEPWVCVPTEPGGMQTVKCATLRGQNWSVPESVAGVFSNFGPSLLFLFGSVVFGAWTDPTPLSPVYWAPLLDGGLLSFAGEFNPGSALVGYYGSAFNVIGIAQDSSVRIYSKLASNPNWSVSSIAASSTVPGAPFAPIYSDPYAVLTSSRNPGNANYLYTLGNNSWTISAPQILHLPPGAALTCAPPLQIFGVDKTGALTKFVWQQNNTWAGTAMTASGFAPPGAPVVASYRTSGRYPGHENLFVVGNDGGLWVFSPNAPPTRISNPWLGPSAVPGGVQLLPGSFIEAGYQSSGHLPYSQLDIFAIDASGTLQIWWESQGSGWHQLPMRNGGGLPPGAPIGVGYQQYSDPGTGSDDIQPPPPGDLDSPQLGSEAYFQQLNVYGVDSNGALNVWCVHMSQTWVHAFINAAGQQLPGAYIATGNVATWLSDLFIVNSDGWLQHCAVINQGSWASTVLP